MGELATSPPPTAVLRIVFVDGDQTVNLGTITVQPSLGVRKLQGTRHTDLDCLELGCVSGPCHQVQLLEMEEVVEGCNSQVKR